MIQFKYEYLLPIGSIVRLKNGERKLMIFGILQRERENPDQVFDYVAVPYPEGMQDMRLNVCFNHDDIEEIICRGYEDDDRKAFLLLLEATMWKMEQKKREGYF